MLKICTVYFDGFYTPDYVERLHDSLRKHSSIDFEFVCLSDTDVKADVVLPYNHNSNIVKHFDDVNLKAPSTPQISFVKNILDKLNLRILGRGSDQSPHSLTDW